MVLSEWREFPSAPCLAGKKNLMTARFSMLLKSRASLTWFVVSFLVGLRTYQHPDNTQSAETEIKFCTTATFWSCNFQKKSHFLKHLHYPYFLKMRLYYSRPHKPVHLPCTSHNVRNGKSTTITGQTSTFHVFTKVHTAMWWHHNLQRVLTRGFPKSADWQRTI